MLILVAVFVFYRSRRRREQWTASSPDAPKNTPHAPLSESFVINNKDEVIQTNTTPGPSLPSRSTTPMVRSLSTMKREQTNALSRYGDIHTVPNGIGQPSQGLQGPTGPGSEITPGAGIGNPAVLEEMHSLLVEMRRLATEQGHAPPSYS